MSTYVLNDTQGKVDRLAECFDEEIDALRERLDEDEQLAETDEAKQLLKLLEECQEIMAMLVPRAKIITKLIEANGRLAG